MNLGTNNKFTEILGAHKADLWLEVLRVDEPE